MARGESGSARSANDLRLAVRVIPRADRNEVVGWLEDGTLKLRLQAPPVEGAANKALVAFLSEILGIRRRDVQIERGRESRNKLVRIRGISDEDARVRIDAYLG